MRYSSLTTPIQAKPLPQGRKGDSGDQGPSGPTGNGIPEGGEVGQVLVKTSEFDYGFRWLNPQRNIDAFARLFANRR